MLATDMPSPLTSLIRWFARCVDLTKKNETMLGQGRVKLADFGLVRSLDDADVASQIGSNAGDTT